jgi:hypothetical protein
MKVQTCAVLVFKTSVTNKRLSEKIRKEILLYNNVLACNFDLEDCDNILRIESKDEISEKIITHFNSKGLICEVLI